MLQLALGFALSCDGPPVNEDSGHEPRKSALTVRISLARHDAQQADGVGEPAMLAARLRTADYIAFSLALTAALVAPAYGDTAKDVEPGAIRNAIFNGEFLDGKAGWTVGGPRDIEIEAHHKMVAHRPDSELVVRHGALAETMGIYSPYPIGVKPGKTYTLTLTAGGEGDIAFGAYEYTERDKNTIFPLSERIALTPESQTYTFTYVASEKAVTIRPRVVFFGKSDGSSGKINVRLLNLRLLLPQAEFLATTNWPEWAVSGELSNYKGLSKRETRAIRRAVAVDGVLPPYEPIRGDGEDAFVLTTSRFHFGRSVFPDSISVLDTPILADRMLLEIETDDGQSIATTESKPALRADDEKVALHQTIRGKGWTLSLDGTLAHDGLMIYDVDLRADDEVHITSASLSIPFSADVAKYIRYSKDFGEQGWCFGEGPIPSAGETVEVRHVIGKEKIKNDWGPRTLVEERGTLWEWSRGVPRYFWIGDEEKGLGWITESDRGWSNGEGDVTWALERTPGGLVARMHFVTQPMTVKGSWNLRFMIQAMPPKPVRDDWFKMRFNRFWNWEPGDTPMIERIEALQKEAPPVLEADPHARVRYVQAGRGTGEIRPAWESLKHRGLPDIGFLWWDVWSVGCGSPQVARPELMKRYLSAGSYVGHMVLPYLAPTHLAIGDLNGYYYASKTDAWAKEPPAGGTSYTVKICANSFASEYQAYEIGRLIDEYGIAGVYFDNTHPEECSNRSHGCGYVDEDGVTRPTTPFLGMRRLFSMVRNQFLVRGKTPFIMKHAGMFPATISFTDAQLDGEGTYGYDHTQMFTTAEFRARYIGANQFGIVEVYLPQFGSGTDTTEVSANEQITTGTRRLMALTLVHGTPIYCGAIQAWWVHTAWGVLDELRGPTVDFIPYWEWPFNEKLNARDIYASIYHQPEQSVLVVSNLSASDAPVAIPRAELDRLIPGLTSAQDNMDGHSVELDDASLRLRVQAKNFRLISLH